MIIMKFGGSSLRDSTRINEVIFLIKKFYHEKPLIVCSALGSTTNDLIKAGENAINGLIDITEIQNRHLKIAKDLQLENNEISNVLDELKQVLISISILKELPKKILDLLMSFGERLSVRLMSLALTKAGFTAKYFDAFKIGFTTNAKYGNAELLPETYLKIKNNFFPIIQDYKFIPVITGFIAQDKDGNITTLGRSGSDLTASVVGAALNVKEVQVWKDVDGLLSTDPRIVPNAIPVGDVSFEEASELAYFGAKVLHPLAIQPAMASNIPVRVRNSYNPDHTGTLITANKVNSNKLVKVITCKRNVTLIDIVSSNMLGQYGFLAYVFKIFNDYQVSVDMVATSEVSISLSLDKTAEYQPVIHELQQIANTSVSKSKAIISLICDVNRSSEILDLTFKTLHNINVNVQMITQGASKVNISFVVNDSEVEKCVKELHKVFFEEKTL